MGLPPSVGHRVVLDESFVSRFVRNSQRQAGQSPAMTRSGASHMCLEPARHIAFTGWIWYASNLIIWWHE